MYATVENSTELQYIVELGAQRLMPIHPRPPTVSTGECLRILRGKANAWNSFDSSVTKDLRVALSYDPTKAFKFMITHQQLSLSAGFWHPRFITHIIDLGTCIPGIANVPSCVRGSDYANLGDAYVYSRYIDATQDLMITVNFLGNNPHTSDFMGRLYGINFCTLSTNKAHPFAHESRLELVCRVSCDEEWQSHKIELTVLGDRLAFYSEVKLDDSVSEVDYPYWSLHVWNWREGGQSDVCMCLVQSTAQSLI
jgi:hypothetical protein